MEFTIKTYTQDKYLQLSQLVNELQQFEASINHYRSTDDSKIDAITQEIIKENKKKNGKLLLVEVDNQVVGFISFYQDDDVLNSKRHLHVSDLVISERYRGKGLARELMQEAEKYSVSEGLSTIRVAVLANSSSKDFYYKIGYVDETIELVKEI